MISGSDGWKRGPSFLPAAIFLSLGLLSFPLGVSVPFWFNYNSVYVHCGTCNVVTWEGNFKVQSLLTCCFSTLLLHAVRIPPWTADRVAVLCMFWILCRCPAFSNVQGEIGINGANVSPSENRVWLSFHLVINAFCGIQLESIHWLNASFTGSPWKMKMILHSFPPALVMIWTTFIWSSVLVSLDMKSQRTDCNIRHSR